MKTIFKYLLFAIFLSLSASLFAQNFIKENKLWRLGSQLCPEDMLGPNCTWYNQAYKFQGDSVINDTIYVKLMEATDESLSNWNLQALWRETDDKKIFIRSKNDHSPTEYMYYDFSLEKGDTLQLLYGRAFVVDSVSTKMWGGKMRKHWYLNLPHAEGDSVKPRYSTTWIEDVGQVDCFLLSTKGYNGWNYMFCFYEDGKQVYNNPEFNTCFYTSAREISVQPEKFKVFPNPVSDRLFIARNQSGIGDTTIEFYSPTGVLIRKECVDSDTNPFMLNLQGMTPGSYVVRIIPESGPPEEKVIVKK